MDLPVGQMFSLREPENQQVALSFSTNDSPEDALLLLDPLSRIARLAGFSDPERWWETVVERTTTADRIFPEILEMMAAFRDDKTAAGQPESRETLLREAHMRQTIRAAAAEGFGKIAIVCGAWHGPALSEIEKHKASADAALLKGLKKIKT